MPIHRFTPEERLHKPGEFLHVKKQGSRFRTAHFLINYINNGLSHHRLGMVVPKRQWNAVQRNRIKRCIREFYRLHKQRVRLPAKDLVIVALPGAERLTPKGIAAEILAALAGKEELCA
jgi:ribonuclease P protein component